MDTHSREDKSNHDCERQIADLKEQLAVCEEQFKVAVERTQSWKNIAEARQMEIERLQRYEQAVKSLTDQICSPKTTAEQMAAQILGEPMPGKRASR